MLHHVGNYITLWMTVVTTFQDMHEIQALAGDYLPTKKYFAQRLIQPILQEQMDNILSEVRNI